MPLHWAAQLGASPEVLKVLSGLPKAAASTDALGRVALHYAAATGKADVVKAVLEADPEAAKTKDGAQRLPCLAALGPNATQEVGAASCNPHMSTSQYIRSCLTFKCCMKTTLNFLGGNRAGHILAA